MSVFFICLLFSLLICVNSAGNPMVLKQPGEDSFCSEAVSLLSSLPGIDVSDVNCDSSSSRCTIDGISCKDSQISAVNWSGFGLTSIPSSIFYLPSLKTLDLSFNQITTLPTGQKKSPVQTLNISHCDFTVIPGIISSLRSLKNLVISYNQIEKASKKQLQNLDTLDFSHNKLQEFPFSDITINNLLLLDHNCFDCAEVGDAFPDGVICDPSEQRECPTDSSSQSGSNSEPSNSNSGTSSSEGQSQSDSIQSSSGKNSQISSESSSGQSVSMQSLSSQSQSTSSQSISTQSSGSQSMQSVSQGISTQSSGSQSMQSVSQGISTQSSGSQSMQSVSPMIQSDSSSFPSSSSSFISNSKPADVFVSEKSATVSSSYDPVEETSLTWLYVTLPLCGVMLMIIVVLLSPLRHKIFGALERNKNGEMSIVVDGERLSMSLSREIGKGSFGTVWLAESGTLTLAAKEMARSCDDSENEYKKEMEIMAHLDSKYVVHVYGSVVTDESYFIAMEYVPLGSLSVVFKSYSFSSYMRTRFMLDVAYGMEYLHSQGVIHRDLKPGNVLVSSVDPDADVLCKITDFGASRKGMEETSTMTMTCGIGSPYYMSPEMLRGDQKYTRAVDVYSFGIMSVELWNEEQPFAETHFDTPFAFARYVLEGNRPAIRKDCPGDLAKLVARCWEADRLDRPPFATVVQDLKPIVEDIKKSLPEGVEHVTQKEEFEVDVSSGSRTKTKGRSTHTKTKSRTSNGTKTKTKSKTRKGKNMNENSSKDKAHDSSDRSVDPSIDSLADASALSPVSPVSPMATPKTPNSVGSKSNPVEMDDLSENPENKLVVSENV